MRTGSTRRGRPASAAPMRSTISRNAAMNSGRAFGSGRTQAAGIDQRQEATRSHRAALQPAVENRHLAGARMQILSQTQQRTTIPLLRAGEHDRETGHEEV